MEDKKLTYKDAGVDTKEGERAVSLMKEHVKGTFNENDFVPLKALCCCLKLHTFLFFEKRRHIFNKFFDVPLIHQFSGLTVDFCQMEAAVIDCK